jgi:internalin A
LQALSLGGNQLKELPAEIGKLRILQKLYLQKNELREVPIELWSLSKLQELSLSENELRELPAEIGKLRGVQKLYLNKNELREVPSELWHLTNLQILKLNENQLNLLPVEVCQLRGLQELYLGSNRLDRLPSEVGHLTKLQTLNVDDMLTLLTPPPEIVARGRDNMLAFLRELEKSSVPRYEAKLLLVGEGGTGKSSLSRALRNEVFNPHLSTTHGIEVDRLNLLGGEIALNMWDFGGQHIYHSTHQFFFTKRSLYVVVWSARLGAEQGRLSYWLDTIKSLAPDARIVLVATYVDERGPDLNYQFYKALYPQLVGHLGVSNKQRTGLVELEKMLLDQASQLPLVGQPWPMNWLTVEKTLLARPEYYIDADEYARCCATCGVEADIANGTLGNYLHDLGKILYFRDDDILSNLVVLKPNWVTKAISRVLDDEAITKAKGILRHSELPRIWGTDEDGLKYEWYLYPAFLRLMEKFELSYQIEAELPGGNSTSSLIPLLLPHEPPANLPAWPKRPPVGHSQVEMVYHLDSVPAGIMSRFIVRTQQYTKNLHWREGVMLEYQGHQARVELNPVHHKLHLIVQGPLPQNFFTILMNTVDVILARFEGLTIRREIPCTCHWEHDGAEACPRTYRYEDLIRRMRARKYIIECPEAFAEVSVQLLLYGIHSSTNEQVMRDIQQGQQEIRREVQQERQELQRLMQRVEQQSELIARDFTRQWNMEMQKLEAECPNTFVLTVGDDSAWNPKNWVSQECQMHLVCQHPSGPHRAGKGYSVRKANEWWRNVRPWVSRLVTFFKYGVPLGKAIGVVYDAVDVKLLEDSISLMEEIVNDVSEFADEGGMESLEAVPEGQQAVGPALRAIYNFLKEADAEQVWGGLSRVLTPDGNILWLCETHRKQYEVKPLKLEV